MKPWRETWQRATVVTTGTTTMVILALTTVTTAVVPRMAPPPAPQPITITAGLVDLAPQTAPAPRQAEPPSPAAPPPPSPAPLRQAPFVPKPKEPQTHPPTHVTERAYLPPSQIASPAPSEKAPPPPGQPSKNEGLSGGTSAARAIVQPSPLIPPELRHHVLAMEAVVRFTIAANGDATAELEEATPDPGINQILLDTFQHWRFFPALKEGMPIASTLILRVPIKVE